jgi:hypothetical protein
MQRGKAQKMNLDVSRTLRPVRKGKKWKRRLTDRFIDGTGERNKGPSKGVAGVSSEGEVVPQLE